MIGAESVPAAGPSLFCLEHQAEGTARNCRRCGTARLAHAQEAASTGAVERLDAASARLRQLERDCTPGVWEFDGGAAWRGIVTTDGDEVVPSDGTYGAMSDADGSLLLVAHSALSAQIAILDGAARAIRAGGSRDQTCISLALSLADAILRGAR